MLPPTLYLAGVLEAKLYIHYRSDSLKMQCTYRTASLTALLSIQQAFGGIAHRVKQGFMLALNVTQVSALAAALLPLSTPWAPVYRAMAAVQAHKATVDGTRASHDLVYREAYDTELQRLIGLFQQAAPEARDGCEAYRAGAATALGRDNDPATEAQIQWARPQQEVQTEVAQHKAAKVRERLAMREAAIRAKETAKAAAREARRERVAKEQATREAQWAQSREQRAQQKVQAKVAREQAEKARCEQELAEVAAGFRHCRHCGDPKPLAQFNRNKKQPTGYQPYCKICVYERYTRPGRERTLERCKAWQAANPETFRTSCRKQRRKPLNLLRTSLRTRMKMGITETLPSDKHIAYAGCSMRDLRAYIETLWAAGMAWETYGNGSNQWVIDHIVPVNAFDLSIEQHRYWCWNYRNLRPLWSQENALKSDLIGDISPRQLRASGRETELHSLIGAELERLGIATEATYLESLANLPPLSVRPTTGGAPTESPTACHCGATLGLTATPMAAPSIGDPSRPRPTLQPS